MITSYLARFDDVTLINRAKPLRPGATLDFVSSLSAIAI